MVALVLAFGCCVVFCLGVSADGYVTLVPDSVSVVTSAGFVKGDTVSYSNTTGNRSFGVSGTSAIPDRSGTLTRVIFDGLDYNFLPGYNYSLTVIVAPWANDGSSSGFGPVYYEPDSICFRMVANTLNFIYKDGSVSNPSVMSNVVWNWVTEPNGRAYLSLSFTCLEGFISGNTMYFEYTDSSIPLSFSKRGTSRIVAYAAVFIDSAYAQGSITGKLDDLTDFNESQQTELGGTVDSAGSDLEAKLGVLSFADQALTDFISVFADDPGPAQLTLPGFKIEVEGEEHEIWADTPYSLASLEDDFGPLLTAVRFGTVVLVYAALISYLGRVLDALLHGSDVKEE